jgi:hypothetical protein
MMLWFFRLLAGLSAIGAAYTIWLDLTSQYSPSLSMGKFWYDRSPQSLQYAETIVSRYLDPCGLITALDCTPFLWHPTISMLLGAPAALDFIGLTIIFGLLSGRSMANKKGKKPNWRRFRNNG